MPMKVGGGKEPHFWCAFRAAKDREIGVSLETPTKIRELQSKLYMKAKEDSEFRFYQLYDKVYRADILAHAWALSRENGGAPGVDGVTFGQIESDGVAEWLEKLGQELRSKSYEPAPVRRVMIPKPGGGERPLGIPTIKDRVVQTVVKLIIEPIFEAGFEPNAYGYRPAMSALDAVKDVHRGICQGYTDVVDADLSKYFDTIPHHELMLCVARRIVDRHILKLIKAWLKAPVEAQDDDGRRRLSGGKRAKCGTPQGGVISPLLANISMHRFLRAWKMFGKSSVFSAKLINYADDFVILTRGTASAALEWTSWVMGRIGLSINTNKTRIVDARREKFKFLGYDFGPERYRKDGHSYLAAQPAKAAVARLKAKVRAILRAGIVDPWEDVRRKLNQMLRGWVGYFSYGTRTLAYRAVDNYVLEAVSRFLRRRHKVRHRCVSRFGSDQIFDHYGVLRLRTLQLGGATP